ncbi:biotin/lipoyl-binding protein [Roseateles sp. BYS96W]|uniref:Biotin/lipoyl-binding protein n=1 Tax=Pelomonas nitida TaxID=3299027 RepID=A0ABW7G3E8_9BURK
MKRKAFSSIAPLARRLAPVALTLALTAAGWVAGRNVWTHYTDSPWTRDAHIRADVLQISPDVSGLITAVNVRDNQPVHRGDVLFMVDRARFDLALGQARAALAQARAAAGQARANLANQRALLAQAEREDARNRRLADLVAQESVEQGQLKVSQAQAALALAQAGHDAAQASVAAASATMQVAELNLERTTVRSPVDGYLNDRAPHVGDYVATGRAVLSMVDAGAVYVDGYFEETKLDKVHVGEAVNIQIMGQSQTLQGRVQSIAAGIEDRDRSSGSNLLPNVNPSFNWVRLAQRIPVRISIDHWPAGQRPTVGRTATVSVMGDAAGHTAATAREHT